MTDDPGDDAGGQRSRVQLLFLVDGVTLCTRDLRQVVGDCIYVVGWNHILDMPGAAMML